MLLRSKRRSHSSTVLLARSKTTNSPMGQNLSLWGLRWWKSCGPQWWKSNIYNWLNSCVTPLSLWHVTKAALRIFMEPIYFIYHKDLDIYTNEDGRKVCFSCMLKASNLKRLILSMWERYVAYLVLSFMEYKTAYQCFFISPHIRIISLDIICYIFYCWNK